MGSEYRKPFDGEMHELTDVTGRQVVKNWLDTIGLKGVDHPDPYAIDLIIQNPNTGKDVGYAEVEIRIAWKYHEFPVQRWGKYCHVPHRKEKFLNLDLPMMFCSINRDLTGMLWCTDKFIQNSEVGTNPRQKRNREEVYFKLDAERMSWVDLRAQGITLTDEESSAYFENLRTIGAKRQWS